MNFAEFFAGMLVMTSVSGLIIFLILRPWIKLVRLGWENSHEVITEGFHLSAARIRQQTAEENNTTMRVAIGAEETRSQLIEIQGQNDQAEIERREKLKKAGVDPDAPPPNKPKSWFIKHRYLVVFVLTILALIIMVLIKTATS
ncbi:MAG: hypothetical protein Q8O93_01885 [bacterium]|nr:hypothetical protein [bacterium]